MSELKSFIVLYDGKFIRAYKEAEADKVIARNKYKRCVAMAKWCDERIARIEKDYAFWRHGKDYAQNFYKKWRKRWWELAEKLKEAK